MNQTMLASSLRILSDARFDEQFGFTEAEVAQLLADYHLESHLSETKEWYDGYHYRLQIQEWFQNAVFSNTEQLTAFWKAIEEGDTSAIEKYLNKTLSNSISVFDTKARKEEKESSYHTLLVGLLAGNADWLVKSNVEAGDGFADIIVETDDPDDGIVIELKYAKEFTGLESACERAIAQIKDRRYDSYLKNDGRFHVRIYGMAFCKKRCKIVTEQLEK